MPIILQVCLVIVSIVFVVVAIFVIRLLLRLEKTADEVTLSARAFRESLSEATLAVREVREAVAPIHRAAERFGRLGDRAAGITSTLLDEIEEPVTIVLSLLRGLRGVAGYFLTKFSGRGAGRDSARGKTHEEDSPE
jgi:hypothetical protein